MAVIQFVAALGSCHSGPCLRELWKFVFWWQLWDKKAIERDRLRGVNTDAHLSVWEKREKLCVCVCFTCLCVIVWSEVSDQEQLDRSWSIASGHATLSGPVLVVCDKKKRESKCFFWFFGFFSKITHHDQVFSAVCLFWDRSCIDLEFESNCNAVHLLRQEL